MSVILQFWPVLLSGLIITCQLTLGGILVAAVAAFSAGLARLSGFWVVRVIATIYLEIFRGTSALVQMFWIFFVLPLFGITFSPFIAGVLAIGLNTGSYGSEIVRSAILAVPRGQTEAGIALNYTPFQRMIKILIPQAIPMMLPSFGNLAIELLKLTSVVSLITIADLTFSAQLIRAATGSTTAPFLAILVVYFVLSTILIGVMRFAEGKLPGRNSAFSERRR